MKKALQNYFRQSLVFQRRTDFLPNTINTTVNGKLLSKNINFFKPNTIKAFSLYQVNAKSLISRRY